jgi:hypothetical protein
MEEAWNLEEVPSLFGVLAQPTEESMAWQTSP